MKKILFFFALFFSLAASAQTIINFRGLTINVNALYNEVGQTLSNSIIDNTLEEGRAPYLVASFTNRYSNDYLIDILKGNIAGKDSNVVRLVYILYSTDLGAKTEIVSKLMYIKNKTLNITIIPHDSVSAYFENRQLITGNLIAVNKATEVAIIEYNNNLFNCNYYNVIP